MTRGPLQVTATELACGSQERVPYLLSTPVPCSFSRMTASCPHLRLWCCGKHFSQPLAVAGRWTSGGLVPFSDVLVLSFQGLELLIEGLLPAGRQLCSSLLVSPANHQPSLRIRSPFVFIISDLIFFQGEAHWRLWRSSQALLVEAWPGRQGCACLLTSARVPCAFSSLSSGNSPWCRGGGSAPLGQRRRGSPWGRNAPFLEHVLLSHRTQGNRECRFLTTRPPGSHIHRVIEPDTFHDSRSTHLNDTGSQLQKPTHQHNTISPNLEIRGTFE